jgi:O-antigen/teichoic acid export membrane protein
VLKEILETVLLGAAMFTILPAAILLFVWMAVYGVFLVPVVFVCWLIWRKVKDKNWMKPEPLPEDAVAAAALPPRKKIMIKWQGKEMPLGIFVASMISTIVLVPVFIFLLIFYIPPFWSVMIVGFCLGSALADKGKKEAHG